MKNQMLRPCAALHALCLAVLVSPSAQAGGGSHHGGGHGQGHGHGPPPPLTLRVVTPFATGHILADTAKQFSSRYADTPWATKASVWKT